MSDTTEDLFHRITELEFQRDAWQEACQNAIAILGFVEGETVEMAARRVMAELERVKKELAISMAGDEDLDSVELQSNPITDWVESNRERASSMSGHYVAVNEARELVDSDPVFDELYARVEGLPNRDSLLIGRLS